VFVLKLLQESAQRSRSLIQCPCNLGLTATALSCVRGCVCSQTVAGERAEEQVPEPVLKRVCAGPYCLRGVPAHF
jgi:hypothetical protein